MWIWENFRLRTITGVARYLFLAAAIVLVADAFWLEPSSIRIVHHTIDLDRADAGSIGSMRIAVIGDLHAGAPFIDDSKMRTVVALANEAKPDVVLLAGDFVITGMVGGRHISIERIATWLKALRAPLGVFAVIGNHDRWENASHIAGVLEKSGLTVLENRLVTIRRGSRVLYLVSIGDYATHASQPEIALAGVPAGQAALCITHSPDVFPELASTCLLTIAAHTHGGQVWLPFFGRLSVPSKYGQRYAVGLFHENGKYLFVSSGIGTSILPIRFGVPPEVSILDVHVRESR